ncbi:hypothetical protein MJ575_11435 [Klebsiella pneumoniae]|nr:hypothetical protein MJ575_11435 [Klebsiella pneumoniae]
MSNPDVWPLEQLARNLRRPAAIAHDVNLYLPRQLLNVVGINRELLPPSACCAETLPATGTVLPVSTPLK